MNPAVRLLAAPATEQTPRVLDILAEHGAKATFFLIGERAARAGALVRRIAAAGHDLGNHTWSHRSLWLSGPGETGRQVRQGHDAIAQAAGAPPPPTACAAQAHAWSKLCRR